MKKIILGILVVTIVAVGTYTPFETQKAINIQRLADGDTG